MTAGTSHQALYRRWRAQTFSEIVGQEAVVATLRNAVTTGKVAHALLFTGPRGTGKTSLARIVAKALNCADLRPNADPCDACPSCVAIREGRALDLVEIDAASNRGINDVRELRERLNYAPTDLRRKVYILDEAHQITKDAWNALLKSLEEPPDFVTFMFASTHPQDFPPAILSRLQRFDVRRLTPAEITGKLVRILDADGREADPEAIDVVARLAAGGMRDAESILDQLLSSTAGRIEADAVRDLLGLADGELVDGFVDALAGGDAGRGIGLLDRLEERGRDLRVFLDQVVDALRARILAGLEGGEPADPAIAGAARRLAAIDPTRLGPGGLRLQLELALLEPSLATRTPTAAAAARSAAAVAHPSAAPASAAAAGRPAASPPSPAARGSAASEADRPARTGGPRPEPREVATEPVPGAPPRDPGDPAPEPTEPAPEPTEPAPESLQPAPEPPEPAPEPLEDDPARAPVPARGAGPDLAAAAHAAADPADDLGRLLHGWRAVVAEISRRPALKQLIEASRPVGIEGNVVTLGYPEEKSFLREHAEKRKAAFEEAIGRFLGHPVGVRCVVSNLAVLPPLPDDQEAAHILSEATRIFAEDRLDVPEVT